MSDGKQQVLRLNIVVSSGSGTGTIQNQWDTCRWFRLVPTAESVTYDMTIKDGDGYLMISRTNNTGTLSEEINRSMGIMRTIEITSASQDGTFVALFELHS
jgi:hypothetical protein